MGWVGLPVSALPNQCMQFKSAVITHTQCVLMATILATYKLAFFDRFDKLCNKPDFSTPLPACVLGIGPEKQHNVVLEQGTLLQIV